MYYNNDTIESLDYNTANNKISNTILILLFSFKLFTRFSNFSPFVNSEKYMLTFNRLITLFNRKYSFL